MQVIPAGSIRLIVKICSHNEQINCYGVHRCHPDSFCFAAAAPVCLYIIQYSLERDTPVTYSKVNYMHSRCECIIECEQSVPKKQSIALSNISLDDKQKGESLTLKVAEFQCKKRLGLYNYLLSYKELDE